MSRLTKSLYILLVLACSLSAKLVYGSLTISPGDEIDLDAIHSDTKPATPDFTLFNNDEPSLNSPSQLFETSSRPFLVYDREDHLGLNSLPESLNDTLLYEQIESYRENNSFIGIFSGFDEDERFILRTDRGLTAVIRFRELYQSDNFDYTNPTYDSLDIEYWLGESGDFEGITSTLFIDLTKDNQGEAAGLRWNRIHFSNGTILNAFDQQLEGALYYSILSGWSANTRLFRNDDPADTVWHESLDIPTVQRDIDTVTSYVTDQATGETSVTATPVMLLYQTTGDESSSLFPDYSPAVYRDIFYAESDETVLKFQIDSIVTDTSWGPSNNQQVDVLAYKLKWAVTEDGNDRFPSSAVPIEQSTPSTSVSAKPLALIVQEDRINLSRSLHRATIELFTVTGRRVYTSAIQGDSLHLPSFSTGIYHYRITSPMDSYRGNILIQ